jgi:PAS domain S-box-containing protein
MSSAAEIGSNFRALGSPMGLRVTPELPVSEPRRDPDGVEDFLIWQLAEEQASAVSPEADLRFKRILDALPSAVYTTDASGRITHFNRACVKFSGRTPTMGSDLWCVTWKLFNADGSPLPHDACPMAIALKEGRPNRGAEAIAERPDGTRIWFQPYPTPVKDRDGKVVGAINMLIDITERKRIESLLADQAKELSDLHRRKDEFLAMLSHELRNPLAPLTNAVQLLRRNRGGNLATANHALTIIERQVRQLTRLVDDLLEVSRITTGRIQLREELLAGASVVERAVEATRSQIEGKGHRLRVSLPDEPVWLRADSARLEQVLVNLLNNAAKYTDPGGEISVNTSISGGRFIVRVRDSGIGIPAELKSRVFDLFTQAERSLDRSDGGLGIGLALARRLIEMHAGSIDVESEVGKGSEFTISLPVALAPQSVSMPTSHSTHTHKSAPHRILIVDDNQDSAETLAMLLRSHGHEVRMVFDSMRVLEAAWQFRPSVIVLDIGLPGMSGFELAARIRQVAALSSTSLIAYTGYNFVADRHKSIEAGFSYHLAKPATVEEFDRVLAQLPPQSA